MTEKIKQYPFMRLMHYAKPHRKEMILASIYSILNCFFDLLPEVLLGIAVNVVVNQKHSFIARLGIVDPLHQLVFLAVLVLIVWVLESIFEYLYQLLWKELAQTIQHEMRLDLYRHVQELQMGFHEQQTTGGLLSVINDDINQLERFLNDGLNDFIQLVTGTLIIAAIYFYLSPSIAIITFLPIPLVILVSFKFARSLEPLYMHVRQSAADISTRLANNIIGISTIKSYTTQKYEIERVRKTSEAYRQANYAAIKVSAAFIPIVRMVIVLGFVAALVLGGWYTINGYLDVGVYSILVFQTQRLLWPFTDLAREMDFYRRAMASVERVLQIVDRRILITGGTQQFPISDVQGAISFKDVSFTYPQGQEVFSHLSFDVLAGKTAAFVGLTGSGKSTIIKLLLRFYDQTGGQILLDGIDITSIRLKDLRRAIGLVSQDVFLFDGTIVENIAYGSEHASHKDIVHAAQVAEADDFIVRLPNGYKTIVGERGQLLSGGQRQRISIARAILKNPPIFIFDEATSAVDNETEAAIQRSLERIAHDHTMIIIAHRLSTIRHADIIYVLDEGKIVQSGTHEQLVKQDGLYAALWHVQTGD